MVYSCKYFIGTYTLSNLTGIYNNLCNIAGLNIISYKRFPKFRQTYLINNPYVTYMHLHITKNSVFLLQVITQNQPDILIKVSHSAIA